MTGVTKAKTVGNARRQPLCRTGRGDRSPTTTTIAVPFPPRRVDRTQLGTEKKLNRNLVPCRLVRQEYPFERFDASGRCGSAPCQLAWQERKFRRLRATPPHRPPPASSSGRSVSFIRCEPNLFPCQASWQGPRCVLRCVLLAIQTRSLAAARVCSLIGMNRDS